MRFKSIKPFTKDLKKLTKRFRTLPDDGETLKKVLTVSPDAHPPFSMEISGLGVKSCVIKVRKIACRSLPGKGSYTGLRLVYAWFEEEEKIVFVEIYFKGDKENEDRERILEFFE
ncbi:MAG: hypothetical protein WD267_08885 [Balneolales bacterium]